MQLELFEREKITLERMSEIVLALRQGYWLLRNIRQGTYGNARRRKIYRQLAVHKKHLLLAGIERSQITDMLSCYRLKCRCGTPRCKYFG